MRTYRLKNIILMTASLFMTGGLFSCVDDKLSYEEGKKQSNNEEGGALIFAIDATRGYGDEVTDRLSRPEDDEERIVNPDNFNVVIFSEGGSVWQIWENQDLTAYQTNEVLTDVDGNQRKSTKYYVKIPTDDIAPEVINKMRTQNFKIAVFANWAEYPAFTTSSTIDTSNGLDRNNIFYITHCKYDPSYQKSENSNPDEVDQSETLVFLTGKGFKMGMNQDWVAERFSSDKDAEADIRLKYDVKKGVFHSDRKPVLTNNSGKSVTFTDMKDYDYYNVWQVWNFGGEKNKSNAEYYKSSNNTIRDDWAAVNDDCYKMAFPSTWQSWNEDSKFITGSPKVRGLTLKSEGQIKSIQDGDGFGIILPKQKNLSSTNQADDIDKTKPHLLYKISADGTIYVRCKGTEGAKLVARRGGDSTPKALLYKAVESNLTEIEFNNSKEYQTEDDESASTNSQEIVRVTGLPEDLYLYALGGDITIYEIEYVKSRMIQNAERQLINPTNTPEGGISMYGIQDFDKVPLDTWPSGTTFNLSSNQQTHTGEKAGEYSYRTISLLRSVAKVEIFIPTDIFPEPSHMYVRTLNRFSRSNPMDVFTPTDLLWDGFSQWKEGKYEGETLEIEDAWQNKHIYSNARGVDEEIENIKTDGYTYEKGNSSLEDYQKKIGWLFGLWNQEFGWSWYGKNNDFQISGTKPYPRIFNTRINRIDYAHLIDGGRKMRDGKSYYYYYGYIPEKNVTDPNSNGKLSDDPKVIRIEMRFGDRNTDDNLDDNASYRIYFAKEGGGGISNRNSYDSDWEKGDTEHIKKIYPVMRNHLYRFVVTGIQMNELKVDFEVKGPESRDINYTIN